MRINDMGLSPLFFFLLVIEAFAQDKKDNTPAKISRPEYSFLSYVSGLVVMLTFVVVPVGMMAYRNRNSIVEFIKNR
jgi:hypothetical protein